MKRRYSVQCRLQNGNRRLVTWIPEIYANKGAILRLRNHGVWENGWEVLETGNKMDYKVVCERSLDHKKMKEVTDI